MTNANTGMKWVSSLSLASQIHDALAETSYELSSMLGGVQPDVLFVFVSPHHAPHYDEISTCLNKKLQPAHLLGCSGGGIIGAGREAEKVAALSVSAAILPNVEIKTFRLEDSTLPDSDAGPRLWEAATGVKASSKPHFVILADPFSIQADAMLEGLDFAFPEAVKIGGLASGAHNAGQNALYMDHQLFRSGAIALALTGDICIDTMVAQGCRPIGKPMSVTKCQHNILIELDKRRALEVLAEIFEGSSERDRQLIRTSLFMGLVMDSFKESVPKPGDYLIRNLMGMDAERGVLAVNTLLREGQTVQFHLRDAHAASEDLSAVLRRYTTEHLNSSKGEFLPPPPRGALLFSCLGRGVHLYGHPNHDTQAFQEQLGDIPLAGFFCNGEIGPVSGVTHIHGFTSCFGLFRTK